MLGIATVLLGSCADAPGSCDLDTASLVLRATISDLDSGVEAEIELSTSTEGDTGVGGGTNLALCPGTDRLLVNGVEADEVYALGHLYYTVEFAEPVTIYEIVLERGDEGTVTIPVEAPPSFEISAPAPDAEHSRGSALEVSWAPAWPGYMSELSVSDEIGSSCIEGLGSTFEVPDEGSYVVGAGTLDSAAGGACEATVSLTRISEASYPAALAEGGSVAAIVKRRRAFTSVD